MAELPQYAAQIINEVNLAMKVYLAIKHPEHPFQRGAHTAAGTVEKVFQYKAEAQRFVAEKNKRATYAFWSVKTKLVDCKVPQ